MENIDADDIFKACGLERHRMSIRDQVDARHLSNVEGNDFRHPLLECTEAAADF